MSARAFLAVLLVALAGCSGDKAGKTDDDTPQTGDGPAPLNETSEVEAPEWAVGQWWEWEFTGMDVTTTTFCSIVLTAGGGGAVLVTENDFEAKREAAYDRPLLGDVGKDLAFDLWGEDVDILDFPLADGKSWTATMPNIAWDVIESDSALLEMTASFDEAIGEGGGFFMMGMHNEHHLLEAEYDPAIGWFTGLRFFDVDEGAEGLEWGFELKSSGLNYTGPYFQYDAALRISMFDGNGFTDFPTEGGEPFLSPQPVGDIRVEDGEHVFLEMYAESVLGVRVLTLTDPDTEQRQLVAQGDVDGDGKYLLVDEPGIAGLWRAATAGAGGYSVAGIEGAILTPLGGTMG